jgi:hypothetical protein
MWIRRSRIDALESEIDDLRKELSNLRCKVSELEQEQKVYCPSAYLLVRPRSASVRDVVRGILSHFGLTINIVSERGEYVELIGKESGK